MYPPSTSSSATKTTTTTQSQSHESQLLQDCLTQVLHSRRLLLHTPLYQSPTSAAAAPPSAAANRFHNPSEVAYAAGDNSFDANVVMVLSVLLCALICSLGLNSIIRCALRCSSLVSSSEAGDNPASSARLANTGVKKKALKTFPMVNYSTEMKLPGLDTECVICLSEFTPGERVRVLPKCNHGFHVRCIDKWLNSHSSCPTCRHCLIETCQKIVGCGGQAAVAPAITSSSTAPAAPQQQQQQQVETIVSIAPLEPEGLIRNYRAIS